MQIVIRPQGGGGCRATRCRMIQLATMNAAARVDLVDDDPAVLRALSRLMRSRGLQVRSFSSGSEFLNSLDQSNLPDCLVLDVQMPEMSGLELFAKVNALAVKMPVIFITAHEDHQAEQLVRSRGAVAFLYKPLRADVLFSTIRAALDAVENLPLP